MTHHSGRCCHYIVVDRCMWMNSTHPHTYHHSSMASKRIRQSHACLKINTSCTAWLCIKSNSCKSTWVVCNTNSYYDTTISTQIPHYVTTKPTKNIFVSCLLLDIHHCRACLKTNTSGTAWLCNIPSKHACNIPWVVCNTSPYYDTTRSAQTPNSVTTKYTKKMTFFLVCCATFINLVLVWKKNIFSCTAWLCNIPSKHACNSP